MAILKLSTYLSQKCIIYKTKEENISISPIELSRIRHCGADMCLLNSRSVSVLNMYRYAAHVCLLINIIYNRMQNYNLKKKNCLTMASGAYIVKHDMKYSKTTQTRLYC